MAGPVGPVGPLVPFTPAGPVGPVIPVAPVVPVAPGVPVVPVVPVPPVVPVVPVVPVAPLNNDLTSNKLLPPASSTGALLFSTKLFSKPVPHLCRRKHDARIDAGPITAEKVLQVAADPRVSAGALKNELVAGGVVQALDLCDVWPWLALQQPSTGRHLLCLKKAKPSP